MIKYVHILFEWERSLCVSETMRKNFFFLRTTYATIWKSFVIENGSTKKYVIIIISTKRYYIFVLGQNGEGKKSCKQSKLLFIMIFNNE